MTIARTTSFPVLRLALTVAAVGTVACQRTRPVASAPVAGWVGTWATSQQLVEPGNLPPQPGLSGNTLRQVMRVSLGGPRLRARFSNVFGDVPLTITAAAVAPSLGGHRVDSAAERVLTFGGNSSVTIDAGRDTTSDVVSYPLAALSNVAITARFARVPTALTGHPGSRTTSYIQSGDAVRAPSLLSAVATVHWYVVTAIDVPAADGSAAVVTLGNSITDGRGSGTDKQNRWPDELARRLHDNPATRKIAVLNAGIGGNCVLRECLGPSALARLDRDVLRAPGVRWLIVLEGVNDIGQARDAEQADSIAKGLTAAYRRIVERAHARGIAVYGATILPFGGSFYDRPFREAARVAVNEWIRRSGAFDAVIDLDAAMRDPARTSQLAAVADGGDHLHPNEVGYRMMAAAIDLELFRTDR